MAYRRKTSRTSARRTSAGRSTRRASPTRRPARRAVGSRRRSGGGQTIKLVIEHSNPGAARPDGMTLPQVESTTKKARF